MDKSLLKNCLKYEFYEQNKTKLRASLFEDTLKEVYRERELVELVRFDL